MSLPCRPHCSMACSIDGWTNYLLDDTSDFRPGARLSFLISWGRVPLEGWADAIAVTVDTYGIAEAVDALRWLSELSTNATWTDDLRMRARALAGKYEQRARVSA